MSSEIEIAGEVEKQSQRSGRVIVKNEHLHPEVRESIASLLGMRTIRGRLSIYSGLLPVAVAAPAFWVRDIPAPTAKSLVISSLFGALGAGASVFSSNQIVANQTARVANKVSQHGLLAPEHKTGYELPDLKELRKTHPLMLVDRKGNLHLVPRTRLQQAIAKAQETFLKQILPFRKRESF